MVLPTEGWTLLHQHTKSRQCSHHEPIGEFGGGNTSVDGNSSQVWQVEKWSYLWHYTSLTTESFPFDQRKKKSQMHSHFCEQSLIRTLRDPFIHAPCKQTLPQDPVSILSELTDLPNWIWMNSLLWFVTASSEVNRHRHRHKRYGVLRESQSSTGCRDPSPRRVGFKAGSPVWCLGTPKSWLVASGLTAKTELSAPIPAGAFLHVFDAWLSSMLGL